MLFSQFLLTIIFLIPSADTILEDDILYDIKWHAELPAPLELDHSLSITSKRNEKYSCALPTVQSTPITSVETILFTEMESFLESLHLKKTCIYRFDSYWVYELCHGAHIRQYHEKKVADKRTIAQEYFLGYYHSDNQDVTTNTNNQQIVKIHYKTIHHREIPMLSIRYTDGTQCDINSNKPREIVILYVCSENGKDEIINFQELSSCYYEMTVSSSALCQLPAFSAVEQNRHTIDCYPQENAQQKPRNLVKLENDRELSSKITGNGAQFTMTGADGTTFIISYEYINEGDLNELKNQLIPPENHRPPAQPEATGPIDREFLEGFLSGRNCLTGGAGWWRYEICYGKHIIQFHDDVQQRTAITLGRWNTEKHIEWINTHPIKEARRNHIRGGQYVPLYYTDGDMCELTKTPRMVEVKLRCSKKTDKSQPPAMYLVEPETCFYVLGVESSAFCDLINYSDSNGIPDQAKLSKRFEEQ